MDRDDMVTLPLSLPELEDTYETNLKWGRSSNGEHIWSSGQRNGSGKGLGQFCASLDAFGGAPRGHCSCCGHAGI